LITAGKRADIEYLMEQAGLNLSKSSSRDADYVFSSRASNNSVLLRENPVKKKTVPKVIGLTMKDAIPLLENLSLKVERKGYGRVRQQSITPGSTLLPGSTIKLVLSE
jgi:cell division protein FtsI (penicillin-binding protein 3)